MRKTVVNVLLIAASIFFIRNADAEDRIIGKLKINCGNNVYSARGSKIKSAFNGLEIFENDEVATNPDSVATIIFSDNSFLRLNKNTDPACKFLNENKKTCSVKYGEVHAKGDLLELLTNVAEIFAHSELDLKIDGSINIITVKKGIVDVKNRSNNAIDRITDNQQLIISDGKSEIKNLSPKQISDIFKWSDNSESKKNICRFKKFCIPAISRISPFEEKHCEDHLICLPANLHFPPSASAPWQQLPAFDLTEACPP